MKTKFYISALALLVSVASASAQSATVIAGNIASRVNAPVFDVDEPTPLSGPGFVAQLYAGLPGTSEADLLPATDPLPFFANGYFFAGTLALEEISAGSALTLQIRAWDTTSGETWELAGIRGQSGLIDVVTGGVRSPPSLPPQLVGLTSFSLEDVDQDDDGILDEIDQCIDSDTRPTVVIGECDSGVVNLLFETGCTLSDLIHECADSASNHRQSVSCVAHLTNNLKSEGIISNSDKRDLRYCAAHANQDRGRANLTKRLRSG